MSKYEIRRDKFGGWDKFGDWDLYRDTKLIAWWCGQDEKTLINVEDEEVRVRFRHIDYTPATEAHGLLILNAIKQQLESGEQP